MHFEKFIVTFFFAKIKNLIFIYLKNDFGVGAVGGEGCEAVQLGVVWVGGLGQNGAVARVGGARRVGARRG